MEKKKYEASECAAAESHVVEMTVSLGLEVREREVGNDDEVEMMEKQPAGCYAC